jgi:hypothetical protein
MQWVIKLRLNVSIGFGYALIIIGFHMFAGIVPFAGSSKTLRNLLHEASYT